MKNQAVIYTRVSTVEQVSNFSLANQEKQCRAYCAAQGWPVARVFREEGESAKTDKRAQFQFMFKYCEENKARIGFVVIADITRFSRETADYHRLLTQLGLSKILLRSATQVLDETPIGKLMGTMLAAFGCFDNNTKADKTVLGMKAAITAGTWPHRAPLGYLNSPSGLVHDLIRAPLIKTAFERMATGAYPQVEILRHITAAGLARRNGKPLALQWFNKTLRNPLYAGRIEVKRLGENPCGNFEPIVPPVLFDEVQMILMGKRKRLGVKQRLHPDFPLRVFVRCGHCNEPLTGSWSTGRHGKKYANYSCRNGECRKVNTRKDDIESSFMAALEATKPSPVAIRLFEEVIRDVLKQQASEGLARVAAANRQLKVVDQKIELLEAAYLFEKRVDAETYERQLAKLREQRLLVQIELGEATTDEHQVNEAVEFSIRLLSDPSEMWRVASPEHRAQLQRLLYPQGLTFKDGLFGIAPTCVLFSILQLSKEDFDKMASPRGGVPVAFMASLQSRVN